MLNVGFGSGYLVWTKFDLDDKYCFKMSREQKRATDLPLNNIERS